MKFLCVYICLKNAGSVCPQYIDFSPAEGVVGCGEGVVYLMSPGRPTDTGLQLGNACYPCSR